MQKNVDPPGLESVVFWARMSFSLAVLIIGPEDREGHRPSAVTDQRSTLVRSSFVSCQLLRRHQKLDVNQFSQTEQ